MPGALWRRTLRPLGDHGFVERGVWGGGVGLFMVTGEVLLALAVAWLRGLQLRSRFRKYQAVFEFTQGPGLRDVRGHARADTRGRRREHRPRRLFPPYHRCLR